MLHPLLGLIFTDDPSSKKNNPLKISTFLILQSKWHHCILIIVTAVSTCSVVILCQCPGISQCCSALRGLFCCKQECLTVTFHLLSLAAVQRLLQP